MKKLLVSTLALSSIGFASDAVSDSNIIHVEPRDHLHCLTPKAFVRKHTEIGYVYKTFGLGLEYNFYKPEGLNFKLSAITNGNLKHDLIETENSVSYKFLFGDIYTMYPLLSTRFSSHNVNNEEGKKFFVNKSTIYAGWGWQLSLYDSWRSKIEIEYFKDLHNALLVQEIETFWGKTYSNPHGFRAKFGINYAFSATTFVDLEAYYAKTFGKVYKELGLQLSCQWGF